jgi:hypothetical protein
MPPEPYGYQGHATIARFLDRPGRLLGAHLRLVPTRANGQPAFGCYRQDPQAAIVRSYGLMVLTLEGDRISAITWFGDRGVFPHLGLPRTLHEQVYRAHGPRNGRSRPGAGMAAPVLRRSRRAQREARPPSLRKSRSASVGAMVAARW